jgi:hypothetical protein
MRLLLTLAIFLPVCALSQDAPKKGPPIPEPKNLKLLKGMTGEQVIETMRSFRVALGVQCTYCHVPATGGGPPDFASDENPKKEIARSMLSMAREINAKFPQDGKRRVSCYTCHRGAATPLTAPPPDASAPPK